jgi:enoyl-CoA hydratase/carnithine racemase
MPSASERKEHDTNAVRVEKDGAIATAVIDRAKIRNALNDDVLDGIERTIETLGADPATRVVILRGAGTKAFGSGMDLNELRKMGPPQAQAHFDRLNRCLAAVEACPVPVIAMIYGYAVGGGCELAAACDLRIAGTGARIGVPVGRFGHCPDRVNLQRLTRLISPAYVKAMIMTDTLYTAQDAQRIGFLNWVVPNAKLEAFTQTMATTIAQKSPLGLRALKRVLAEVLDGSVEHATDPALDTITSLWATRDFQEGVAAFLEKRPPVFEGR